MNKSSINLCIGEQSVFVVFHRIFPRGENDLVKKKYNLCGGGRDCFTNFINKGGK